MTEPKPMEYRLPLPPGKYKDIRFSQPFKNDTGNPTTITNVNPNITLQPGETVEIEWTPKIGNDSGIWKIKRPIIN